MPARTPRRQIPQERRALHSLGVGLQALAGFGFVVCFLGFACAGQNAVRGGGADDPVAYWVGAVVCMVLIVVGGVVRSVAAKGVAGSGLVLDTERARDDLEPWARMGGNLVGDALDETRLGERIGRDSGGENPEEGPIRVRCRACRALNDEEARFCDQCGAEL